jgi:hypothetical protein
VEGKPQLKVEENRKKLKMNQTKEVISTIDWKILDDEMELKI